MASYISPTKKVSCHKYYSNTICTFNQERKFRRLNRLLRFSGVSREALLVGARAQAEGLGQLEGDGRAGVVGI